MNIILATEDEVVPLEELQSRPCGGVETAFTLLQAALARRGHAVRVVEASQPYVEVSVPDLFIASRVPRLFQRLPRKGRRILWLHNPGSYLKKPRHLWPLLRFRPMLVVLGSSHQATLPWYVPGRRVEIPLAVASPFSDGAKLRAAPPPIAVFASNPLRGLDWLLEIWKRRIRPLVPNAELHLYTGAATYGGNAKLSARAAPVLSYAATLGGDGVVVKNPLPRPLLKAKMIEARAMLYRGDPGETFCLALAEAQAIGLPCVVTSLGAVSERVQDGQTGYVASDDDAFAAAAVRLLSDDAHWQTMHGNAIARGPGHTWDDIAERFEALAR